MEKIEVVATMRMSDGNAQVGEMWNVTATFPAHASVYEILMWAAKERRLSEVETLRRDIVLTIAQKPVE